MFETVFQSVNREVMATQGVAGLRALGHELRFDLGYLHGGPQLGVTRLVILCGLCGKKFEFKQVSDGDWKLDKDSKNLTTVSCADFRAQKIAIRNRWAQMMASWSKNHRLAGEHR